jgi:hypothetical protein
MRGCPLSKSAALGHDQTSAQQCPPGAAKRFSEPRESECELATGIVGRRIGGRTTSNAPATFQLSRREHIYRKKTALVRESAVDSSLQTRRYLLSINMCLSDDFYFDSEEMS